jgi:hypothetical protein
LALELEALETGWRLGMHDTDWEGLLGLAHQHGWRPSAGLEHYLLRKGRLVVSPSEARELASALEVALRELPRERRRFFRPERKRSFRPVMGAPAGSLAEGSPTPPGPGTDYRGYFSWGRRWIVEEVRRLCRQGAVEIRPL